MSQDEKKRQSIEVDHLMAEVGKRTASSGAIAVAAQIIKAIVQLESLMVLALDAEFTTLSLVPHRMSPC